LSLIMVGSLVALGLVFSVAARLVRPRMSLAAADNALRRGDFAAARARLARHLDHWPDDANALLMAARAARRADECAEAEQLLSRFEVRHGATDGSRLEWALLGVQQGDGAAEERSLVALRDRQHPETPLILEALAKGCLNTLRGSAAVAYLDQLTEREPGHVTPLILHGKALDGLRRTTRAADDFRRAVTLAPDSADARLGLAAALSHAGHTREAVHHYEILRLAQPLRPEVLLGLARAHCDAAALSPARERLDDLLRHQPDHPEGLVERGRLALRRGRPAEAEPDLSRAARVAPWHRDGHQLLFACLNELGRSVEAERVSARINELRVEDAALGRLSLRFRDAPDDPANRCDLGVWLLRNGQGEMGVRWLLSALRVDPRHGPSHAALADHFQRAGQPRRAALHRALASPGGSS
jgi:tetratricopeptide (TPR) repeat protein